jgi:hypothetical protein
MFSSEKKVMYVSGYLAWALFGTKSIKSEMLLYLSCVNNENV